jgi:hypothetical protein
MIMIFIYSMPVSCLRRRSVFLFIHLSLVPLGVCATPHRAEFCVCLPSSADRAFEPVKGVVPRSSVSVVGSSRRGRDAKRNSAPCFFSGLCCTVIVAPPTSLGHGHHGLEIGALITRTR